MSAWAKLRVFAPQLTGGGLTCSLISAAVWLGQHSMTIVMVPAIVICGVFALVTAATAINKIDSIQRYDWDAVGYKCHECDRVAGRLAAVTKDRDELRETVLALEASPATPRTR